MPNEELVVCTVPKKGRRPRCDRRKNSSTKQKTSTVVVVLEADEMGTETVSKCEAEGGAGVRVSISTKAPSCQLRLKSVAECAGTSRASSD